MLDARMFRTGQRKRANVKSPSMRPADPALDALLLPLRDGLLRWPREGALFLGARAGAALHAGPLPGLVCVQASKPEAEALERAGFGVAPELEPGGGRFPLVLLLPPRQREQARAGFARAMQRLAPGGVVLAAMPNREGAKSGEADLARLAGPLQTLSKHHCRVFWTQPLDGPADSGLVDAWSRLDAPRPVEDARVPGGRFLSRPGVFAWDRIDAASLLLAEHLPADLRGRVADLGAGWGYLAGQVLARCPGVAVLDLYEADAHALALARANLEAWGARVPVAFHWHDVAAGIGGGYDAIVTNPPFHGVGHEERPDLGRAFIAAAAAALSPGGRLWLVANRHLPYEAALGAGFGRVREVAARDGFKVVEAVRA
jgi:16S rRNA (guanine1207-N2)-methyltransferase